MTISSPPKNSEIILNIEQIETSILQKIIAPLANEIDRDQETLKTALMTLGKSGLLALKIPQKWGGLELNQQEFFNYQLLIARYSGALAFLQTQHQSAAAMLASSQNTQLQQQYLPHLSHGKILLGIGFSQLRRSGEPPVKASPTRGGYYIEGIVPWITGWSIFQEFILAAKLPDGRAVFGILPLIDTTKLNGSITFSEIMPLCAMTSTNTVSATVKNWFLPDEQVVSIKPVNWIHNSDRQKVLAFSAFALGCALAGIDIMKATSKTKPLPFIPDAISSLQIQVDKCRNAIEEANKNPDTDFAEKLHLRATAINLAQRCTAAAVTVSSGAANHKNHGAQRVYREALVYTVSGQTTDIMEATLKCYSREQGTGNREQGEKHFPV
ncbi:MAG: acyl-CoA/acyl-ACP dehydrogenase [Okeania sp. SIO3H1]|uniref:acyl-CoA dehydrogenase family protein n=1 Tax=Okeania sp. SIO1I7 TaxID=2607772 RepID=UPI0013C731D0|nr:acyl-CoA dehydrogenase family protein [Okeania sp. SIO1I7]NEN92994.1 acyl-CoA/acyl-ACP dehydrogenase [Okeania sp. SIO3H1]NET24049.1 acyl-CoA/acyl-ACP dehydrogenase [Okeania sp. SIO1I7]